MDGAWRLAQPYIRQLRETIRASAARRPRCIIAGGGALCLPVHVEGSRRTAGLRYPTPMTDSRRFSQCWSGRFRAPSPERRRKTALVRKRDTGSFRYRA